MLEDTEIVIRLLLAALMGGIIGLERERKRSTAGLRTHMLVSLGSSLLMILSILIPERLSGTANYGDSIRLAAGVVTGIGFLGAGTIIKHGSTVRGLTTAASIWAASALGLTIGAGFLLVGAMALLMILIALYGLKGIDEYLARRYGRHVIYLRLRGGRRTPALKKLGNMLGDRLKKVEIVDINEEGVIEIEVFTENMPVEDMGGIIEELGRGAEVVGIEVI
ncbi:MAG: MgtC/SapB family protein [Thermoplasmata archaeon]|nr:MgtC/SapB family protein [Thermoplasmata archaeon]